MDRRESLKTILISTLAGTTLAGCKVENDQKEKESPINSSEYGRTPEEKKVDAKLMADSFFSEHELTTIAVLCDIILPADNTSGSASDAGVPKFIEFIVKDIPSHQLPLRGGLMWLDAASNQRYEKTFIECAENEKIALIDLIAYQDKAAADMMPGVKFFTLMRNLTLTGFYTTKMGIEDLGYQGNRANVWDGVPEEVLKDHDVDYDPEWIAKCIDQSTRTEIAKWDEKGNLI